MDKQLRLMEETKLRADLTKVIQLTDAKALGLVQVFPSNEMKKLYLEVVKPRFEVDSEEGTAPEGYELFAAKTIEEVAHQNSVLKKILEKKYEVIDKMIELPKKQSEAKARVMNKSFVSALGAASSIS